VSGQAGKFALACGGVVAMAFASEWLAHRRRAVHRAGPTAQGGCGCGGAGCGCGPPAGQGEQGSADQAWRWRAVLALLYGAQVTLGYFLMLAAMTYQVGLGVAEFFLKNCALSADIS
jgi:MFS family permease